MWVLVIFAIYYGQYVAATHIDNIYSQEACEKAALQVKAMKEDYNEIKTACIFTHH